MIRKAAILVLTLGALTTGALTLITIRPQWRGGWCWRSSSCLGVRVVLHHRTIVVARDEVLPGQPDPLSVANAMERFREAQEAGETKPSHNIMEDSFAHHGILGARWGEGQYIDELGLRNNCRVFLVPLWVLFVVFVTYLALAFLRGPMRRWRRRRKGLCVKCGYNLTGLPEPRCPECGGGTLP